MSGSIVARAFNNVDNHVTNLYQYVSGLFDVNNVNNKFSDVQLKIGNTTYYCHKFVLSLNSKYFANSLTLSEICILSEVFPDYFYDVLQFMYTGEIVVTTTNIESLLTTADILCMDDLLIICLRFIYDNRTIITNDTRTLLAQLYSKLAVKYFDKLKSSSNLHLIISEEFVKVILSDDNLRVKSEEQVCEMLMNWLQVQTKAENKVHSDQLLSLIRWSDISADYVKSKLLTSPIFTSESTSGSFLSKVMIYLLSGVQFEGLQTFHRRATDLENCLVTVGLDYGKTRSGEVCCNSLQHPDKVTQLTHMPTEINFGSFSCMLNSSLYITGVGSAPCKQTWSWNALFGWIKCADMLTGRYYHCAAVVDSMLYVLGGWVVADKAVLTSVECYNTKTKKWLSAGHLFHAVSCAACVTYNNSIYVFGGLDEGNKDVAHVQVYNPSQEDSTSMDTPMPRALSKLRAVSWETSVILLYHDTCFLYNFETETWQEMRQFMTGVEHFASVLDNSTVYIAGGGVCESLIDDHLVWNCTDEIKSVSVLDIVQNKPVAWKHHGKLSKPVIIESYVNISLPSRILK